MNELKKKKIIVKILVLCIFGIIFFETNLEARAETVSNGMTIPTSHPRIFWTPAKISQAQQWATDNSYTGITSSNSILDRYDLLFTCLVLGDNTACTNAINDAVNRTIGCDPGAVACDPNRWHGEWVALTYDWLYDQMTPTQRQTIEDRWTDDQILWNSKSWGNENQPNSNYFFGKQRNNFEFGVAFMEHDSDASTLLDYGMNTLWQSTINYVDGADGDWSTGDDSGFGYGYHAQEGTSYSRYGLHYANIMLQSAPILGRDIGSETTAYKAAVFQMIYSTMLTPSLTRGGHDMFSNGDDQVWRYGNPAGSQYYGDFIQGAVNLWPTNNVGKYAQTYIDTVSPTISHTLKSVSPTVTGLSFSNLPLDYYASGPGFFYSRNNWTNSATSMVWQMEYVKGGSDHIHADAGSFQVFRKGANLIRETTGYSESVAGYGGVGTVSVVAGEAHNIPFIGGEGSMIAVRPNGAEGSGEITRLDSDTEYSFVATNLIDTYKYPGHPERTNDYVQKIVRELYYLRDIDAMVIVDRIETDSPSTSTAFISHCETNPIVSGSNIACVVSGQQAKYTALVPSSPAITVVTENTNGGSAHNWQYRIEAENSNPGSVHSYSIYVIEFSDSGSDVLSPAVVDSNSGDPLLGTFTITLDINNEIVINKGMTSTGGTVKANAVTKSLATNITAMTITDNGPLFSSNIEIRADVDQSGGVNSTDAFLTLRNSLGLTMSSTNWQASSTTGDVNCDSNANSTDALLILRESLGLGMSGTGWCVN